jgi:hypothetical protein
LWLASHRRLCAFYTPRGGLQSTLVISIVSFHWPTFSAAIKRTTVLMKRSAALLESAGGIAKRFWLWDEHEFLSGGAYQNTTERSRDNLPAPRNDPLVAELPLNCQDGSPP